MTEAVWMHSPDQQWRLVIATPAVHDRGPLAVYEAIQRHIKGWTDLSLSSIGITDPDDSFFTLFPSDAASKAGQVLDLPWDPTNSVSSVTSSVRDIPVDHLIVYRLEPEPPQP